MSITDSSQPHNFQTIEDELKYWKTSYSELYNKYETLNEDYKQLLLRHTCKTAVPEDLQPPPLKKRKIKEIRLDPIECLPEPCAVEILKYLTVPELKLAMEVSKGWRDFINGQSSLMGKMRLNTTWDKNNTFIRWRIFNEKNKRSYKHLKTSFDFNRPFHGENPVSLYASTLETLEIDINLAERYQGYQYLDDEIFPNLRYLVLPHCFEFYRFYRCSFPALTHLKISYDDGCKYRHMNEEHLECKKLLKLIEIMPKLEVLLLCTPEYEKYYWTDDIDEDNTTDGTFKPSIRSIITYADFPINFFKKLQSPSLTEMKIDRFCDFNFSEKLTQFLQDFKTLKSLTIQYLNIIDTVPANRDEINLIPNESIEVFKVLLVEIDDAYEDYEESDIDGRLEILLRALPSLKELVLFDIVTPRILKFIAENLRHLKKLICKRISPELLRAYHKIQIYRHLYVNTSFELIADPSYEAIIKCEFDFNF